MSPGSWTVAGRLTRWLALSLSLLVVGLCGASFVFLRQTVGREIAALTHEELDEIRAHFVSTQGRPEDLRELAEMLAAEHAANPMAWRVWRRRDGSIWTEVGEAKMLANLPQRPTALARTTSPQPHVRARIQDLDEGLVVGLALDGSANFGLLHRYGATLLGLGAAAVLLGILGARWVAQRVADELRAIAARLREVEMPRSSDELAPPTAPEEIRAVADALQEMLANIRRQQDHARLLTAGLAHELRSPVQNLLGQAEVALMRPRRPEDYQQILESQVEELRDLGRVVDNLVVLCSPTDAPMQVRETFDLGAEMELRLSRERAEAKRRGVVIELSRSGDLVIEGDREAALLAVNNVVGNAVRWSPQGSTVHVSATSDNGHVRITVDDSGPGVPPELREAIFEPFFQGPVQSGNRLGYGLGLALVRTAVEAHAGSIHVSTSPTGGARFEIDLARGNAADALRRP